MKARRTSPAGRALFAAILAIMVTIGAPPRVRRAALAELIDARNASLTVSKLTVAAKLGRMVRAVRRSSKSGARRIGALLFAALAALAAGVLRHGLVLAGLALFVVAAAQFSLTAALITGGVAAFFLEARRR